MSEIKAVEKIEYNLSLGSYKNPAPGVVQYQTFIKNSPHPDEFTAVNSDYVTHLEQKCAEYKTALNNWIEWEAQQIKKDGPYVGDEINKLINEAKEVLERYGK